MNKEQLINKLDKLNAFFEGACEGLSMLKEILDSDDDSSPQPPVIPNSQELEPYFEDITDPDAREVVALQTYRIFADSMAGYADFIEEQWNSVCNSNYEINKNVFEKCCVEYIVRIFYQLDIVFNQINKTKWGSSEAKDVINKFNFSAMLMCDHDLLNETYDIEFLGDLCELWEILTATVDAINIKYNEPPFSDRMGSFSACLSILNERMIDILNSECSMWSKKRAIKTYFKGIKRISSKLSDVIKTEAFFLKFRT